MFTDNSAEKGSALHFDGIGDDGMWNLQVDVINCTLAANVSETDEGAVYVDETRLTMWNNILRNAAPEIMHVSEDSLTTVIYSNVLGGHEGEGNIDAAPLFVDAENGDYHLHEGSPAIDAGTGEASRASEELGGNWRVSSALSPDTDLEGKRRPVNGLYDMGAYEFGLFGDVNKDGVVNAMDVQVVINTALDIFPFETAQDLTGDGKVNALDIQLAINAVLGQV